MSCDLFDDQPTLVFDEALIDSVRVDCDSRPVAGLPADFDIQPVLDEILNAVSGGSPARALRLIDWLFCSQLPLGADACLVFIDCFRRLIPDLPKPMVSPLVLENQRMLTKVLFLARHLEQPELLIAGAHG